MMILHSLALGLPLLWSFSARAQSPGSDLEILIGRGELLQFGADISRVAVAEPKVADAVVVSPREVMVNAKGVGHTTVIVWESAGRTTRYNVHVVDDQAASKASAEKVAEALKQRGVAMETEGDTVVLKGEAPNAEEAKRIGDMVAPLGKVVVNLLKTPEPKTPQQIMLQVKFASVDRVALSEFGINYFSRNPRMLGALATQQFATPRFSQLQFQDQEFANSTLNFSDLLNIFLYRPDLNIGATIRALQTRNLLQILAEPNLIAVEGKEASFLAGGQFPFPTLAATSTGGAVAPVVTVQFKSFGVELNFTPTVTPEGKIHLKVNPSVSALDFSNAVQLQGFLIPAISTRTASTEVELKDGESFAIAGLLDSRVVQSLNKIPWLGDVPILGNLFKSRSTKKSQDELLVVITPTFVRPLPPEEKAKLPATIEPFLQSAEEELAEREAKKKKKRKGEEQKPAYVGPSGYAEPGSTQKKK